MSNLRNKQNEEPDCLFIVSQGFAKVQIEYPHVVEKPAFRFQLYNL